MSGKATLPNEMGAVAPSSERVARPNPVSSADHAQAVEAARRIVEAADNRDSFPDERPQWSKDLERISRALLAREDDARQEDRKVLRRIELRVDSLNTKGYRQQKNTQAVLDAIKADCRAALTKE